jgi:hypothetical protein
MSGKLILPGNGGDWDVRGMNNMVDYSTLETNANLTL